MISRSGSPRSCGPLMSRWPGLDADAIREANRKQAVVPVGATVLDPVGTAPGLVVPPASGSGPTVVVLPGPPRELHEMWEKAVRPRPSGGDRRRRSSTAAGIVRLYGIPESEIANTLRAAADAGLRLEPLEITTCLRRGEIEVATRYEASARGRTTTRSSSFVAERHRAELYSPRRLDRRRAGRLAARAVRLDGGRRRVVHGRSDVGPPDRARRVVRVLRGRCGGVLQRGEGLAGRGRSGVDRAGRRRVGRGRRGAGVRRCSAVRRRFRDRDHRDRRTGRRQRGEAGRHRLLLDLRPATVPA